jgi:AraC-like DNA-binding protein
MGERHPVVLKKGDGYVERMVAPVEVDARGIVAPEAGLAKFRLDRYPPSPEVGRFVDRYWLVSWDLTDQEPYVQQVFAHPVVNVVFTDGTATIHGVTTRMGQRTLEGRGRALGVMFRPAGFRPFLGRAMSTITDRTLPLTDIFGADAARLEGAVAEVDTLLATWLPAEAQPSEHTTRIVERAATDPGLVRVDSLASEFELTVRQLQRRFADHVGASPKSVIRRYRLYEAAERARLGTHISWASLAVELGYSDQAHLTRDFSAVIGMPPDRYARVCKA